MIQCTGLRPVTKTCVLERSAAFHAQEAFTFRIHVYLGGHVKTPFILILANFYNYFSFEQIDFY